MRRFAGLVVAVALLLSPIAGAASGLGPDVREFALVVAIIHTDYIKPVSVHALTDRAIRGIYRAAGMTAPATEPKPPARFTGRAREMWRVMHALATARRHSPAIGEHRLWIAAIRQMAVGLDGHSAYLSAEQFHVLRRAGDENGAIGLGLMHQRGRLVVVYVLPGAPAARVDIGAGDELVAIGGHSTAEMSLMRATTLLRGLPGSVVSLQIRRGGISREIKVRRARVRPQPFECAMVAGRTLYVRPYGFTAGLAKTLGAEAERIERGGKPVRVVLDLQDDPGGVLQEAAATTDLFLASGTVMTLQGRTPHNRLTLTAHGNRGPFSGIPVTVLVNHETAAGAEVVAAALQDHGRATLVGTPTLGLGAVQTLHPLFLGALKLTTYRMLRPSGAPISAGVTPDVELPPASGADASALAGAVTACPGMPAPPRQLGRNRALRYALRR